MGVTKKKPVAPAGKKKSDDIFDDSNRKARDLAEGWFKFEEVGDKVGGEVLDIFEMPERDGMPAQRCFTLRTEEGIVNVGLKRTNYILSRTDDLQIGDDLGVKFEKEIPAKNKGFNPAKSMVIFTRLHGARGANTAGTIRPPKPVEDGPEGDATEAPSEESGGEEF